MALKTKTKTSPITIQLHLVIFFLVSIKTDGLSYAQVDRSLLFQEKLVCWGLPVSLKFNPGAWGVRDSFALLAGAGVEA